MQNQRIRSRSHSQTYALVHTLLPSRPILQICVHQRHGKIFTETILINKVRERGREKAKEEEE